MITTKKRFTLTKSQLSKKFRVENNNLDISTLIKNSGYSIKTIEEIAPPHRKERNRKETKDKTIKYIQISDIDVDLGRIKSYRTFKGSDAPNNARRIINYGDILVSTRRPTRGAIVTVPKEFDQEICTVFFTSLTALNWDEVNPWYLALFLRTSLARFQFQSMITETAYPVISDDDVGNMVVLLPPIELQRKLAKDYEDSVNEFFTKLNQAHFSITSARQEIENLVLVDEAETIRVPRFGIQTEEIVEDNGNDSEQQDETMQAYCIKCRTRREMKDVKVITLKNGRPASQGICPSCGTKMFRVGKG